MELPEWYKVKGYFHISPQSKGRGKDALITANKVMKPAFVKEYNFYPLLHTNIAERKYKKHPDNPNVRTHSYFDSTKKKHVSTKKIRPLHYANHLDALIFGYYASLLQEKYEEKLKSISGLSDCVTAYRKIPVEGDLNGKCKGTIHFAHEAFTEIKERAVKADEVAVLAFDIKSFFSSLDHKYLREKWIEVMDFKEFPKDHEKVLNAATKFSFIYKDDLRRFRRPRNSRRSNFQEKAIAKTGNKHGYSAFFESPKDFRNKVKSGKVRIYKNNFKNSKGETIGIPQGLPISAVLANMYLLDFDKAIQKVLVEDNNCFYRRYSDDLVVVCDPNQMELVKNFVENEMNKCMVTISKEKTETFIFKQVERNSEKRLESHKVVNKKLVENSPLIYLGFEFYGYKTLIKSANLSKFYRRMIYAVKAKSKIALSQVEFDNQKPILYKRQLYRIYRNIDLDKNYRDGRTKKYVKLSNGEYRLKSLPFKRQTRGNYFSYAKRAADIMNEPAILEQIKGEKRVFNQAVEKHFSKKTKDKEDF